MCCVYYATNMIRRHQGFSLQHSTSDAPNRKYEGEYIKYETKKYGSDFCVAYNVTRATGDFRDDGLEPISLVLHATSHYMREIEGQCSSRNWNGPISVSLFVDRTSSEAVDYLHEVHRCSTKVNQKLSLHIVYRMSPFQKVCDPIIVKRSLRKCSTFNATIRSRERGRVIPPFQIYPINVMRNVARKGALSYIHMTADVEMVFSEGFAVKMKALANKYITEKDKKLLVIRRFEVDNKAHVPVDHKELFVMIKAFRAFEFHHKYFPAGHTIESLWQWFRMSKNQTEAYAWQIDYKSSSWEAQLILHRKDPYNPEYIPTRIRDQQSLVYELCRANYTFHLASHVFNVHRGVKTQETNLSSAVLTHQKRLRTRSYKRFMHYINSTYPDTFDQCGKFVM
ncbi:hypothetical protein GCK72_015009 [Caenorhabditis remanei]|uniref:Uncharacterized protein n=1 Tax=Caenorhabditis remanei TaxID=31234 RepID=A0A6A5GSZ3_CAERE|nr:hypothetical protein GCK72_015009 [Caenorhabditis remanei]KAF1758550.1 hypothetical protein GCK72_015009 [Caenorhabditis remanei]